MTRLSQSTALLATLIFFSCLNPTRAEDIFLGRYATRACTLLPELEQLCQVKSVLGTNQTTGSYNGMYMYAGEFNCTVRIQQCRVNTCYSWRDLTNQLPSDAGIAATTGFFTEVTILSGAKNTALTREGFSFFATDKDVVLTYSTQPCATFYRVHGRIGMQLCNQPIEAITEIGTSVPNALDCPGS